jgi:hypothetical protein
LSPKVDSLQPFQQLAVSSRTPPFEPLANISDRNLGGYKVLKDGDLFAASELVS